MIITCFIFCLCCMSMLNRTKLTANSFISSQTYHFFKLFHLVFLNSYAPSSVYPADSQFYQRLFLSDGCK